MRSDFPPVLALAAKANAFMRDAPGRMEVLAGHPAFARFHDLGFVRPTNVGVNIFAEGSLPWFRKLRNEGVARVRPYLAGMRLDKGSDAVWGLLSEGERGLEIWSPNVGRRFQGHGDLQPLRLTMSSGRFDRWSLKELLSVEEASHALGLALEDARARLDAQDRPLAARMVEELLDLHALESPAGSGDLACVVPDLTRCAMPLFVSAARVLAAIDAAEWNEAADGSARSVGEPLWSAARVALETAV